MAALRWIVVLFLAVAPMIGCTIDNPAGRPLPAMTFDHIIPLRIDVGGVQIEQPPLESFSQSSGYDEPFIVPPDEAVHKYLLNRFMPGGTTNTLKIDIEQADVATRETPSRNKLGELIGVAGVDEYELAIKLNVRVMDDRGFEKMSKIIRGTRIIRVSEHASLSERERSQFKGLEALLRDMDDAVTRTVVQEFKL